MVQTLNTSYPTDSDSNDGVYHADVSLNEDGTDNKEEAISNDRQDQEADESGDHRQEEENDRDSEEEEGGSQQAGAGSSVSAEPDSSTQVREFVSREDYQAALLIIRFRDGDTTPTQAPEPPNTIAPPHPASSRAHAEPPAPGSGTSTKSTKSKKRRRKGLRLTHVKNERAKKAHARAEAAAHTANAGGRVSDANRMNTRSRTRNQTTRAGNLNGAPRRLTRSAARAQAVDSAGREQKARSSKGKGKQKEIANDASDSDESVKKLKRRRRDSEDDEGVPLGEPGPSKRHRSMRVADEAPRRLTRSAARAWAIESSEQEQSSKRKGKQKEVAKDEPDSGEAAASSKRRRCDSEDGDDELDVLEVLDEPGPSTRRKRQKLEPDADALGEPSDLLAPDARSATLHSETANSQSSPRGINGVRSLAPEPSDSLIEAERKRLKRETPERGGSERPATSSRVQPENTTGDQPSFTAKEEEEENEPPQGDPADVNTARPRYISEVYGVPRLRHRPRSDRLERQETTLFGNQLLRPDDLFYYRR